MTLFVHPSEEAWMRKHATLRAERDRLAEHIRSLSSALSVYRRQHDAGYHQSHCTCVNCVFSSSLLDASIELLK